LSLSPPSPAACLCRSGGELTRVENHVRREVHLLEMATQVLQSHASAPNLPVTGKGGTSARATSASPRPFQETPNLIPGHESFDSPVKLKISDPEAVRRRVAAEHRQDTQRIADMKSFLKTELQRQMEEKSRLRAEEKQRDRDEFLQFAHAQDSKHAAEDAAARVKARETKAAFRNGLAEQVSELQQRAREARVREAQSAADTNAHCTLGFMEEVEASKRRKQLQHEHMRSTLQSVAAVKERQALAKERDHQDWLKSLDGAWELGIHEVAAQKARLKAAQSTLEKRYDQFVRTAVQANIVKQQVADARVEEQAKVQMERLDNMYARREAARERQRQVNMQELEAQVQAKASRKQIARFQKEAEREVMHSVALERGDKELELQQVKRQQEIDLQNDLCKQMQERFAREGRDHKTRRLNPALSTMIPPPEPLCLSMDLPRYLEKPMGEGGPAGGLPPLNASTGKLRQVAGMSWEPPSLQEAKAQVADATNPHKSTARRPQPPRGFSLQPKPDTARWSEGVTASELRVGRKVAARREKALAIQKDPIADIVPQARRAS